LASTLPDLRSFYEWQAATRPDWHIDVQETIEVDDCVVVRAHAHGAISQDETGRPLAARRSAPWSGWRRTGSPTGSSRGSRYWPSGLAPHKSGAYRYSLLRSAASPQNGDGSSSGVRVLFGHGRRLLSANRFLIAPMNAQAKSTRLATTNSRTTGARTSAHCGSLELVATSEPSPAVATKPTIPPMIPSKPRPRPHRALFLTLVPNARETCRTVTVLGNSRH
jgi:hypothetical protein